jgi:hypothetical protein
MNDCESYDAVVRRARRWAPVGQDEPVWIVIVVEGWDRQMCPVGRGSADENVKSCYNPMLGLSYRMMRPSYHCSERRVYPYSLLRYDCWRYSSSVPS